LPGTVRVREAELAVRNRPGAVAGTIAAARRKDVVRAIEHTHGIAGVIDRDRGVADIARHRIVGPGRQEDRSDEGGGNEMGAHEITGKAAARQCHL
jgi:hypothetical protein